MKKIPLHGRGGVIRAHVLVDDADFEALADRRWFLDNGYACRQEGGRTNTRKVYMHREILGLTSGDGLAADHINMDRLDNRRENLRAVTHAENMQNRRSNGGTSTHRGVSLHAATAQWAAYVTDGGHKKHLGYHATEVEAAAAASNYRAEHMPFAMEAT